MTMKSGYGICRWILVKITNHANDSEETPNESPSDVLFHISRIPILLTLSKAARANSCGPIELDETLDTSSLIVGDATLGKVCIRKEAGSQCQTSISPPK